MEGVIDCLARHKFDTKDCVDTRGCVDTRDCGHYFWLSFCDKTREVIKREAIRTAKEEENEPARL